jgi:hypothetical protein
VKRTCETAGGRDQPQAHAYARQHLSSPRSLPYFPPAHKPYDRAALAETDNANAGIRVNYRQIDL